MKISSYAACLLLVGWLLLNTLPVQAQWQQHYDGVLGTSLDLAIYSDDEAAMEVASAAAVAEIARLEQILSTYRPDSELMQLNASLRTTAASPELLNVLQQCSRWYDATAGKFSCRLGRLQTLWTDAAVSQTLPDRPAVRRIARDINQAEMLVDSDTQTVRLGAAIALDPSGLAKGYIIDRALDVLRAGLPKASAIKVDIGGDAAYWGSPPGQRGWQVGVADPHNTADNQNYLFTLGLHSKAVAASGHGSRHHTIGRRAFSHILVPRDGWPVENGTASVVVADDTVTADAVATALTLQSLVEGIDWVNTLDGVEALVIDSAGRQLSSDGWAELLGKTGVNSASGDADEATLDAAAFTLALDYELPEFEMASYHRPYLAIWISDVAQEPKKNLLLLGTNGRWARENTHWWRYIGRRNPEVIDGVARPTRSPGQYQLQWDGSDDFGERVPKGDYILHIEAARENGGSSYQAIPFSWGSAQPQTEHLPAEGELGSIKLHISGT